jgi:hypothetical protein
LFEFFLLLSCVCASSGLSSAARRHFHHPLSLLLIRPFPACPPPPPTHPHPHAHTRRHLGLRHLLLFHLGQRSGCVRFFFPSLVFRGRTCGVGASLERGSLTGEGEPSHAHNPRRPPACPSPQATANASAAATASEGAVCSCGRRAAVPSSEPKFRFSLRTHSRHKNKQTDAPPFPETTTGPWEGKGWEWRAGAASSPLRSPIPSSQKNHLPRPLHFAITPPPTFIAVSTASVCVTFGCAARALLVCIGRPGCRVHCTYTPKRVGC